MRAFYDLHLHSCLSPCGDADMTPANIAGMAALCGLQVIAVSDHNTCANCPAVLRAAREQGILAVPAMELTTAEEAHVLCLLPDLESAMDFSGFVYGKLPNIPNDPGVFGPQIIIGENDEPIGEEPRLLLSATEIGIHQVSPLLKKYGGIAIPAHIDRPSFSILSNLGVWDTDWGFTAYELTPNAPAGLVERYPALKTIARLTNSDAHILERMRDAENTLELDHLSAREIIRALARLPVI